VAAPLLILSGSMVGPAHSGPAQAQSTLGQLSAQAAKGQFDANSAYDSLVKAGMSPQDASAQVDQLRDSANAFNNKQIDKQNNESKKKNEEAAKKKGADQNASGEGDWDFGQVYRNRDYNVRYPLTNNCKVPQLVTITYPTAFPLVGPQQVLVPAKSTIDVDMVLKNSSLPPIPPGPYPPGFSLSCYDLKDVITLTHPEAKKVSNTPSGKMTWVCHAMTRTHHIKMHVHIHSPPDPEPPGGGGGRPKPKKKNTVCSILWNYGEFIPGRETRSPQQCADDARSEAHDYFGAQLDALRAKDPQGWSWTPSASQIDQMSVGQLTALKARAEAQAKAESPAGTAQTSTLQ
jgi:hypothetical protein